MKYDLTILGIVLVPGVVAGLASASDGYGGNHAEAEALEMKEVSKGAVIIASRLEAYQARRAAAVQESCEALEVGQGGVDLEALAHTRWQLDEDIVAQFGNVNGYPNRRLSDRTAVGHSGCAPSKEMRFDFMKKYASL
jgi:hypothetical protein